jgi:hypothetical protein
MEKEKMQQERKSENNHLVAIASLDNARPTENLAPNRDSWEDYSDYDGEWWGKPKFYLVE